MNVCHEDGILQTRLIVCLISASVYSLSDSVSSSVESSGAKIEMHPLSQQPISTCLQSNTRFDCLNISDSAHEVLRNRAWLLNNKTTFSLIKVKKKGICSAYLWDVTDCLRIPWPRLHCHMGEYAVHCLDLLGLNRITILELKAFAEAQMVQTAQTLDFEVGFQVISKRLGRMVAQHLKEIGDSAEFRVPAGTVDADVLPFPSQGPFDELNQVGDCIRFTQVVVKLDNIVMLVLIRCPDKAKVYSTVFRLPCKNFNPEPVVRIVTTASRQEEDSLVQA